MKNNKKFLCTLLAAFMSLSMFASCGGGNNSSQSSDGTGTPPPPVITDVEAYDGSEVKVTFYHTMGKDLQDVLNLYIPRFNEMYPNITIEHTQIGGYDDVRSQISTELTTTNYPSIAYCYPDHVALYNKTKKVLTLDSYIASEKTVTKADGTTEVMGFTEEQIADFIPGYYAEGRAYGDGKMYTLPYSKSTELLYYNKTYFETKGYEVPTTWDEMEALCAKIKAEETNNIPLGYDSEANWFITMCEQLGLPYTSATGDKFLFNTPEHIEFVEKLSDWYDKGYVTTEEIYGTYTSNLFKNQDSTQPRSYMCIGSSGGAGHQIPDKVKNEAGEDVAPFEVGIASIPQANPSNPKVISQGPSLVLFKKSAQEQAATWLFAKFLTSTVELQAEFSMESGYAPVIASVSEHPVYKEFIDNANGYDLLPALAAKQALAQKNAYYVSPAFDGSSAAREAVGILIQNCFIKNGLKESGLTAAEYIQQQFDDAIDELEFDYN